VNPLKPQILHATLMPCQHTCSSSSYSSWSCERNPGRSKLLSEDAHQDTSCCPESSHQPSPCYRETHNSAAGALLKNMAASPQQWTHKLSLTKISRSPLPLNLRWLSSNLVCIGLGVNITTSLGITTTTTTTRKNIAVGEKEGAERETYAYLEKSCPSVVSVIPNLKSSLRTSAVDKN